MSSTTKKSSRSGSNSKGSSGSRSGSKSSSKSDTKNNSWLSQEGDEDEWTDWAWSDQHQQEYRGRRDSDGKWDYEFRDLKKDSVPRTTGLGSVQEEIDGEPSATPAPVRDRLPSSSPELGTHYTLNTQSQSLDRDFNNMSLNSSLVQDSSQNYGTGTMDLGFARTAVPPGYVYQMQSAPVGSQYMGSSLPAPSADAMQTFATSSGTSYQSSLQRVQSRSTDTAESPRRITGLTQEESGMPDESTLGKDFKLHNSKYFKFGKVFKILWTEPKGQGGPNNPKRTDPLLCKTRYGEECYASIRRFVIIKAYDGHCLCLPILTYRKQGTNKPGVKAQNHAIIYTESKKQKGPPKEAPNEAKLEYKPIRMEPKSSRHQLNEFSRLNYAKIYTVEHNVKVCFIGKIHETSKDDFLNACNLQHQPMGAASASFEEDVEDEYELEERDTEALVS